MPQTTRRGVAPLNVQPRWPGRRGRRGRCSFVA